MSVTPEDLLLLLQTIASQGNGQMPRLESAQTQPMAFFVNSPTRPMGYLANAQTEELGPNAQPQALPPLPVESLPTLPAELLNTPNAQPQGAPGAVATQQLSTAPVENIQQYLARTRAAGEIPSFTNVPGAPGFQVGVAEAPEQSSAPEPVPNYLSQFRPSGKGFADSYRSLENIRTQLNNERARMESEAQIGIAQAQREASEALRIARERALTNTDFRGNPIGRYQADLESLQQEYNQIPEIFERELAARTAELNAQEAQINSYIQMLTAEEGVRQFDETTRVNEYEDFVKAQQNKLKAEQQAERTELERRRTEIAEQRLQLERELAGQKAEDTRALQTRYPDSVIAAVTRQPIENVDVTKLTKRDQEKVVQTELIADNPIGHSIDYRDTEEQKDFSDGVIELIRERHRQNGNQSLPSTLEQDWKMIQDMRSRAIHQATKQLLDSRVMKNLSKSEARKMAIGQLSSGQSDAFLQEFSGVLNAELKKSLPSLVAGDVFEGKQEQIIRAMEELDPVSLPEFINNLVQVITSETITDYAGSAQRGIANVSNSLVLSLTQAAGYDIEPGLTKDQVRAREILPQMLSNLDAWLRTWEARMRPFNADLRAPADRLAGIDKFGPAERIPLATVRQAIDDAVSEAMARNEYMRNYRSLSAGVR